MRREIARVERPVVKYAREKLGVVVFPLKMFFGGETGIPDDLFVLPGGKCLFMEFKDPDGVLSRKQLYWRRELRKMGHKVYVFDDKAKAIEALRKAVDAARLSEARRKMARAEKLRRSVS